MSHVVTDLADAQPSEQTNEVVTGETLTAALESVIERLAPGWLAQRADLHDRLLEALDADPDQVLRLMNYEEFLDWAIQNDIRHAEWVDGKVFLMPSPPLRHQQLALFLATLLYFYVTERALGELLIAPFQMRLIQPPRGREPDLLFIAKAHLDRLQKRYLDGPADLVVEIVSPDSGRRDREEKFAEYESAAIPEYWLIDPERKQAEFYQLVEGRYQLITGGRRGRYTSAIVPGFWLEIEWLWQDPLPPAADIWQQLHG